MLNWRSRFGKLYFVCLIGVVILTLGSPVDGSGSENLTITLYQNGPAVVVHRDLVEFEQGSSQVTRFIPARAISGTVFVDSSGRNLKSLKIEPPINKESQLLESLIGKRIEVSVNGLEQNRITGELVDLLNGNLLLKTASGKRRLIRNPDGYSFAHEGLYRRNKRLKMEFSSGSTGRAPVTFGYRVEGMTWQPQYVGFLDEKEGTLRFGGIAHLSNDTGWEYKGAEIYLLAGSPKRESQQPKLFAARNMAEAQNTSREKVFEYYRYKINFPVHLEKGMEFRVPFLPERKVDYRKYYEYEPAVSSAVRAFLSLKNLDKAGLGVPLAAGTVRIYQDSRERTLLGADSLPSLPEGEEAELELGKSFDLKGTRKVLEHQKLGENSWRDQVQLQLTNRKKEPAQIRVLDKLTGSWEIARSSHAYEKYDSRRILFEIKVPEKSSVKIDYTVKYKY